MTGYGPLYWLVEFFCASVLAVVAFVLLVGLVNALHAACMWLCDRLLGPPAPRQPDPLDELETLWNLPAAKERQP